MSLPVIQPRQCGDCSLCCKLLAIKELNKPVNEWCTHCNHTSCMIYDTRPESCREFECLWMQAPVLLPESLKPSRSKVVLSSTEDGEAIVAHVDQTYPRAHMEGPMKAFLRKIAEKGTLVIAVIGEDRQFLYSGKNLPEKYRKAIQKIEALQAQERK